MISHRLLSSDLYGNGLRGRVTACRKRLRVNRVAQRAQVNNDSDAVFGSTVIGSQFRDYVAADPQARTTLAASVVRMNYASPVAPVEPVESEAFLSLGEEVGST